MSRFIGRPHLYIRRLDPGELQAEDLEWAPVQQRLLALALRLEGEGQYNLAKLARASTDALARRAAYRLSLSSGQRDLVEEIQQVCIELAGQALNPALLAAFQSGAGALAGGRLARIDETPHPYVCRTCGRIVLGEVTEKCPTCGAWPETFQWFPPVYWLEALDPPAALERLRRMPQQVAALLDGLPEPDLDRQPPDGGWSIRNLVTHLRDAQGVLEFRLGLFLQQERPVLESRAVFEWAAREQEQPPAVQEIFDSYCAVRARIIQSLEDLPVHEWWRTGWHEEFGEVTIKQQVSYFSAHEWTHLPQLERLRRA